MMKGAYESREKSDKWVVTDSSKETEQPGKVRIHCISGTERRPI